MSDILFHGDKITTAGNLPNVGETAKNFTLVNTDLKEMSLDNYKGKKKVLSIYPSVDTPVCANSVRNFNKNATEMNNTVVLNISMDLPFALKRFCAAEGINNVETLSAFRSDFKDNYKVMMTSGPLAGVFSRAIIILDENNKVLYTEQVSEVTNEPNYEAALKALK